MDHAFSNKLLLLPLFQGFSRLDFLDIVSSTPFDFHTFRPGSTLIKQGQECRNLGMLLGGKAWFKQQSANHLYEIAELISAPFLVQPEVLFGLHNRYTRTIVAFSEVQAVLLSKQSVSRLVKEHLTFQLNLLNCICTESQHHAGMLWHKPSRDIAQRFGIFLTQHCLRPTGEKTLSIRMEDLAEELGTTRLQVSQMLHNLHQKGLLNYSRGKIHVPSLGDLLRAH